MSNSNAGAWISATRATHADQVRKHAGSKSFTCNSFEFTSFWAKRNNQILPDLVDFTATFFSKHTLLNVLTKYCVFTSGEL